MLGALEIKAMDLEEFLEALDQLVKEGFRLKEEVYLEAMRKARRIIEETK